MQEAFKDIKYFVVSVSISLPSIMGQRRIFSLQKLIDLCMVFLAII